jgi:hypothetical protein
MYGRILLAVDDEGVPSGALVALAGLAFDWRARVHVLHLHAPGAAARNGACRRLLTDLVARLTATGVRAAGETRLVDAADRPAAVARAATGVGADVVAVLGGGGGSRVASAAGLPVLLVPEPAWPLPAGPACVAVERDGDESLSAATRVSGDVVVVSVAPDPARGLALLDSAVRRLRRRAVRARGLLVAGPGEVGAQLAEAADRLDAALVVVGTEDLAREVGRHTRRVLLVAGCGNRMGLSSRASPRPIVGLSQDVWP